MYILSHIYKSIAMEISKLDDHCWVQSLHGNDFPHRNLYITLHQIIWHWYGGNEITDLFDVFFIFLFSERTFDGAFSFQILRATL